VDQITIINVWTKYGEPRLYGNGETDLQALFMKITCKFESVDHENEVKAR